MVQTHDRRRMRLWQVAAAVVLVAGSAAVTLGTLAWYDVNKAHNHEEFQATAQELAASVKGTLEGYGDQIASAGALFLQPQLDRSMFHSCVENLDLYERYPGMYALGLISSIPAAQRATFLAAARGDGLPDFDISPAGVRPTYCVARFAETDGIASPVSLLGFDVCTIPKLTKLLDGARDTGGQQTAATTTLSNAKTYSGTFIIAAPVYRGDPTTLLQRRADLSGWVAALIDGRQLLHKALLAGLGQVGAQLYAGSSPTRGHLVVSTPTALTGSSGASAVVHITDGGSWTVRMRALAGAPGPANPLLAPGIVFILGLLLNLGMAGFVWDLGRGRLSATRSFRASEERFRSMAACTPVGILEMTRDGRLQYCNPRLEEITGQGRDDLVETGWLRCVHGEDRGRIVALVHTAMATRQDVRTSFRIQRPSGELRHVRALASPVTVGAGEARYVATVEDVTEEIAAQQALSFQALHDPLTALPNRALFLDRLTLELSGAQRSRSGVAVMFLDLDRFKVVNDGLGHQAGDELLRAVADRFRRVVRSGETVARLGGDEFTFIFRDISDAGAAVAVANRILHVLADPFVILSREVVISGSIGIVLPAPDAQAVSVLSDADAAMYRAKEAGRARFEIFDEEQRRSLVTRVEVELELRQAIERGEFRVHYQPLVSLSTGRVVGAEALVRWEHRERGLLLPDEFIPVAEESGLIVPLGEWLFTTVAAQAGAWSRTAGAPELDTVAVNVSARQLASPDLCPVVRRVLEDSHLDARRLCIEITESVIMSDDVVTRRTITDLHDLGVHISIDDFGTGYSSLAYLDRLPVGIVKIDKSFIDQVGSERGGAPIVVAIVEMAHALGLLVVAEGVTDQAQRRMLVECGCDEAQGFLWAPAMPVNEFEDFWRRGVKMLSAGAPGARSLDVLAR